MSTWTGWVCCGQRRHLKRIARCTRRTSTPDRILEFLLLDEEFPHSLRFSIDSLQERTGGDPGGEWQAAGPSRCGRLGGRLQAMLLSYSSVDEILNEDVIAYLQGSIKTQCCAIHETIYELYVDYSIQAALAG